MKTALDIYFEQQPRMVPDIGCYIGPGWHPAVLHALERLQALSLETGIWIQPRQIKEKFGSLRFHTAIRATDEEDEEDDALYAETLARLKAQGIELPPDPDPEPPLPRISSEELQRLRARVRAIVDEAIAITDQLCEECGKPEPEMKNLGGYICRQCDACIQQRRAGGGR